MLSHTCDGEKENQSRVDRMKLQNREIVEQFQEAFHGAFEVRQGDGKHSYEAVLKAVKSASEVLMTDEKLEPERFSASVNLMRSAITKRDR